MFDFPGTPAAQTLLGPGLISSTRPSRFSCSPRDSTSSTGLWDCTVRRVGKMANFDKHEALAKRTRKSTQVCKTRNCVRTFDGWPKSLASRLVSSRKSQNVVNFTHIQLTCDQLVSTCVGWPNGEKLWARSTQVGGQTKRKLNSSRKPVSTCESGWRGLYFQFQYCRYVQLIFLFGVLLSYRYRIRGIKNIIFYDLPHYSLFYQEILNFMDTETAKSQSGSSISSITCTVLYTKFSTHRLAGVVGTKRCRHMLSSAKDVHMFVTGDTWCSRVGWR